ncbi:MAG: hypothetical protein K2L51_02605 [Clostridiales bacterium]|nr:hypothetical protein [Clostridiales bacterium]
MKRLKGICLAVLTVVLSVAMLMGTLTFSAFADTITISSNITTSNTSTPATFVKRVKYGVSTGKFAGATKIVTPNGTEISGSDDGVDGFTEYTPYELGVYTVYYGENYSYNVSCYITGEYELRVEYNGADIATYTEVATEAATENNLILPKAAVWFKAENADDFVELTEDNVRDLTGLANFPEVEVSIIGPQNFSAADLKGKDGVKLTKLGTYTVRYSARVGGANGTKYLSKDYTAKVQAAGTINDTAIPSFSLVNMPSSLSLNTKVTLPKGTATDNYDENVKVTVKVEVYDKDYNGGDYRPVREAIVDEKTGYATGETDKEVKFDNEYNLSFYPVLESTYRITYQAIDDKGNKTADTGYVFTLSATDRTAPVLQKIDDYKIPGTWGMQVTRANADTTATEKTVDLEGEELTLRFPVPEYTDNSGKENVSVSFEIKDTTNNFTVVKFENIFDKTAEDATGENAKYTYDATKASNGIYDPYIDAAEGAEKPAIAFTDFALDFDLYQKALRAKLGNTTASAAGNYTVTYRAQDKTPNVVTKTYDIVLQETYTDTDAPNISDLNWGDNYLVFTDEEEDFIIPTPEINDTDSNLKIEYMLYAGSATEGIKVNGGETAKLQLKGEKGSEVATLTVKGEKGEEDQTLTFDSANTLEYAVTATDDVGNVTVKTNGADRGATDAKDDVTIEIVTTGNLNEIAGLGSKITFAPETLPKDGMVPGVTTKVGSIAVELSEQYRAYHGFEISLYTVEGTGADAVTKEWKNAFVSLETYYANNNLQIDNITFAAPKVDKVLMFVRIYDVAGRSYTFNQEFTVDTTKADGDGSIKSALNIGTSGNVYTSYILKNREVKKSALGSDYDDSKPYIKRKIEGTGKFSLTGNYLFTAYNAGTFTFGEYYYAGVDGDKNEIWKPIDKSGSYDWTVTETSTPVWQMQGVMPTYTPLDVKAGEGVEAVDGTVVLPHVVASSEFANAKITLSVEFSPANGSTRNLTVAKDKSDTAKEVKINADGKYYFTATQDGTYTVKYTATYGDNAQLEQTFTIRAGDITAPSFTVNGTHTPTATENSRFKFNAINELTDEQETANLRYTKTLEAPDGTTVFTVEGTGDSYRTATVPSGSENVNGYKFTKTGVYTVRYKVADRAGNESVTTYTITVSAAKVNNPVSTKIISTVLIIVGVLLIAGVILYFVRFRKVKTDKVKK